MKEMTMPKNSIILSVQALAVLAVILTGAGVLSAQFAPGDAVVGVADTTHHLLVVKPNGSWSTLVTLPFGPMWDLIPSADNRNVWLASFGAANGVFDVAPTGVVTTMIALTGQESPATLILDGNGDLYISGTSTMVLKHSLNKTSTLVTGIHGALFGSAIDLNTGDLLLTVGNGVVRVPTYGTPGWSWLRQDASGSMAPHGACYDPANNWLIETRNNQIVRYDLSALKFVTPTPTLPVTPNDCGHVARDPATGEFLVTGYHQTNGSLLFRYDATANAITTMIVMQHAAQASFGGSVALVGSRHLSTFAPAGPGSTLFLRVSSPNEPGQVYVAALSFGHRPGITVGGRTIYLNPDPLFFASILAGGIFQNFVGVLDARGEGLPSLQIPKIAGLSGLRFYAAAITIAQNAISVVSNPIVITIQ